MFSTIKNKLYNNKLKKLYKDHINKYNLLLDNENKYKQENLEDDIRGDDYNDSDKTDAFINAMEEKGWALI